MQFSLGQKGLIAGICNLQAKTKMQGQKIRLRQAHCNLNPEKTLTIS